jgi:hypothetical protein
MSNDPKELAARREQLIAHCAEQRTAIARELAVVADAVSPGGIRRYLTQHKVPLALAGVALGLAMARPKRVLPLLTAGLSAWKMVQRVLPLVAQLRSRGNTVSS